MSGYHVTNEDYSQWNTRTTNLSNEDIYVNLQVNNPPEAIQPVPANYSEYRTQPLLEDGANYKMAITNLYAPGTSIPLFNFVNEISTGVPKYTVTLTMTQDVGGAAPPPGLVSTVPIVFIPYKVNDYDQTKVFVYTFNQLVLMVNDGFERAYNQLVTLYGEPAWAAAVTAGQLPGQPPKIVFNPETQLFSIVVPFLYNADMNNSEPLEPTAGIPFIAISMNWNTFNWFQNLPAVAFSYLYGPNPPQNPQYDNVVLRIYNTGRPNSLNPFQFYSPTYTHATPTSPPPAPPTAKNAGSFWAFPQYQGDVAWAYQIEQQDQSLDNISTVRSIVVRSQMPVRAEFINSTNNSTSVSLVNVLADFSVSLTQGSPILYTPEPVFRYIDILSNFVNQLNYQIYWADQNGDEYPVMVNPGETVEMKLVFTRK
jgi:hypothetical protein